MRREYEITQEQLDALIEAAKPVPYMIMGGQQPASPQENANRAWEKLGREVGFKHMTVLPVRGKSQRFFTAEEAEVNPAAREEQMRDELAAALTKEGVKVSYYGYVEVHVKLMRQGHGTDSSGEPGSGFGMEFERSIRLEESEARALAVANLDGPAAVLQYRAAVKEVLDADDRLHMTDEWKAATQDLSGEDMKAVLALLERRKLDRDVGPAR